MASLSSSSLLCITFLLSLFFSSSFAHMYLSSLVVGGVALPEGECVRLTKSNSPIPSVTHPTMTCGHTPGATTPTARMCTVAANSQVGLQWWWERPGDMVVDPSHKGPCMVYMAKNDGQFRWFKIYEDGYNNVTQEFCVTRLIRAAGLMTVTIPSDLAPGNYLMRGETIALHGAYEKGQAQPYVGCAELVVTGSGSATPNTVSLPGAYSDTDPGLYISIYNPISNYIIPGPAVYGVGTSSSGHVKGGGTGEKGKGLSSGAVAAIVIIVLLVAIVSLAVVGLLFYRKNGSLFGKTLPLSVQLKLGKLLL